MKVTKQMLNQGTQVLYIPNHATDEDGNPDPAHPDCQAGFVMSVNEETAFVRYWSKFSRHELRTVANSEGCYLSNLALVDSRSQKTVDRMVHDNPAKLCAMFIQIEEDTPNDQ